MNETQQLELIHGVAWPCLMLLLLWFRKHKVQPTPLAWYIYTFTFKPTWINRHAHRFSPE